MFYQNIHGFYGKRGELMGRMVLPLQLTEALPGVDVEKGFSRAVYSLANYKKALYCALKSIRFKIPLLDSMLDSGEYSGLRMITHSLCRLLDNIGADALLEQSYLLETAALNEERAILQKETLEYRNTLEEFMMALEDAIHVLETCGIEEKQTEVSPEQTRRMLCEAFPPRKRRIG